MRRYWLLAFIGVTVGVIVAALVVGGVNSSPAGSFWVSSTLPAGCTTDSDCQRRHGGSGDPD